MPLSFSSTQANHLAARGAAQRASTFPVSISYRGSVIAAILSSLQETHDLSPGGFEQTVQATMRIQRILLTSRPLLDETFTVVETGLSYKIDAVQDNPRAPEWVMTVRSVLD